MSLSAVPDVDEEFTHPGDAPKVTNSIPQFEGQDVAFTKAKITSAASLEIDDRVFRHDDIVRFVIEGRVTGVDHKVNDRSGNLERIHTIKAIDALVLDWDVSLEDLRDKVQ